ncbi:MAG: hypothetical protein HDQ87_03340 [Clostridia bacterium]|nr:hypothetical protein [Clostridia bacterium]
MSSMVGSVQQLQALMSGILPSAGRTQKAAGVDFMSVLAQSAAAAAADGMAVGEQPLGTGEAQAAAGTQTQAAGETAPVSLEEMLKARFPGLHYHVFDASSSHWKMRNDYPHYLLYQDGDKAKETLENWQPQGENPFYGSVNGQFIAPKEIKALGSVPPGSKAVVIHPKVQEKMAQDPAYAQEIFDRIETWFAFDTARNEAIMPGSTWDNAQAVAIGEDGSICNACASSPGGDITYSESPSDRKQSGWDLRLARHAEYMERVVSEQIEHGMRLSEFVRAQAAKAHLASMLQNGNLREIFGSEIAGVPTETILGLAARECGAAAAV